MAANPVDPDTLACLLMGRSAMLRSHVSAMLPADIRGAISADDILQDAWIAAFRGMAGVKGADPETMNAWLKTIANNKVLDLIKAAHRIKRGGELQKVAGPAEPSAIGKLVSRVQSPRLSPSFEASVQESADAVRIALGSLGDRNREAITLRFLRGRSLDEVAREMNTTRDAVRGLISRGLRDMRKRLGHARAFFSDARTTELEPVTASKKR